MQDFINNRLAPAMMRFSQQRHLQAVRDGVVLNLVPSMIGSIFLLIAALPIPAYKDFIVATGIFDALLLPIGATLDLMGMTAVIAIAYRLAESYKVDALPAAVISLLSFFLLTPYTLSHELVEGGINGVMPIMYLGSRGLFTALFVGLLSTEIYSKMVLAKITIKMPDGVPPAVSKSFAALIPGAITIVVFWLLRLLIDASPFENIHTVLAEFVTKPLTGISGTLLGALFLQFLVHFFWFFGIHGMLVLGPILDPIFNVLQDQNRIAFQAGVEQLPHIFTRYWFDLYVTIGGAGVTISAIFVILFFLKSKQLKEIGRLSLAPGLFNINEPFVFGLPVVFNPIIFVPWILTPLINLCLAYFATIIEFLPRHNGLILPWTTPPIISGAIVAGWRGATMQIINIALSMFIWFIFLKKLDSDELSKELKKR
ncbi:MAG: PTS sugar transporter subunit IIC [Brevinema sp.]